MTQIPREYKYTESHEWATKESEVVTVGITEHAQQQLGELVYVQLPENNLTINAGDEICVLESVKAAADVFSPVSGKIIAVNEELEESPGLINSSPHHDGWLVKIKLKDQVEYDELLDADSYQDMLSEED